MTENEYLATPFQTLKERVVEVLKDKLPDGELPCELEKETFIQQYEELMDAFDEKVTEFFGARSKSESAQEGNSVNQTITEAHIQAVANYLLNEAQTDAPEFTPKNLLTSHIAGLSNIHSGGDYGGKSLFRQNTQDAEERWQAWLPIKECAEQTELPNSKPIVARPPSAEAGGEENDLGPKEICEALSEALTSYCTEEQLKIDFEQLEISQNPEALKRIAQEFQRIIKRELNVIQNELETHFPKLTIKPENFNPNFSMFDICPVRCENDEPVLAPHLTVLNYAIEKTLLYSRDLKSEEQDHLFEHFYTFSNENENETYRTRIDRLDREFLFHKDPLLECGTLLQREWLNKKAILDRFPPSDPKNQEFNNFFIEVEQHLTLLEAQLDETVDIDHCVLKEHMQRIVEGVTLRPNTDEPNAALTAHAIADAIITISTLNEESINKAKGVLAEFAKKYDIAEEIEQGPTTQTADAASDAKTTAQTNENKDKDKDKNKKPKLTFSNVKDTKLGKKVTGLVDGVKNFGSNLRDRITSSRSSGYSPSRNSRSSSGSERKGFVGNALVVLLGVGTVGAALERDDNDPEKETQGSWFKRNFKIDGWSFLKAITGLTLVAGADRLIRGDRSMVSRVSQSFSDRSR